MKTQRSNLSDRPTNSYSHGQLPGQPPKSYAEVGRQLASSYKDLGAFRQKAAEKLDRGMAPIVKALNAPRTKRFSETIHTRDKGNRVVRRMFSDLGM